MTDETTLSAALEDYLEAILCLDQQKGSARVRDIAQSLSVHKSTVTAALHTLSEKGLINYAPYEITTLTRRGRRIAQTVSEKHANIQRFMTQVLALDEDIAEANACRIEHHVDEFVLDRLLLFTRFVEAHPGLSDTWRKDFSAFVDKHGTKKDA